MTGRAQGVDDPPASAQSPTIASGQAGPYPSRGPDILRGLPPLPSKAPAKLPAIGDVASPYRSEGPPALAAAGTPQFGTGQATGGSYLGAGGAMAAPSPYESTAAPGTASPFALPSTAAAAARETSPSELFAAGGPTDPFAGSGGAPSAGLGGVGSGAQGAFVMLGDASPPVARFPVPAASGNGPAQPPNPNARSKIAPSVRGFKIAENQSPVPQDRIFFSFNSYNDVNKTLNNYFSAPLKGVEIYRYLFGFEKTFHDGQGSIGFLVPIDNIYARPKFPALKGSGGDSTSTGNLTIFLKHVFAVDPKTGSLATGGVAVTPQTGPNNFGGGTFLAANNTTTIQPFFGYLILRDRFYLQGFSALDVPVDPAQATLFYNDIGIGYFVYRDNASTAMITAVAPTFEVHVNSPINHSGAYNRFDNFGTPDIVNLTGGLNTRFWQTSTLTMGAVTPVTGPRPFSIEGTLLLNVYFGKSRRNPAPPIVGG